MENVLPVNVEDLSENADKTVHSDATAWERKISIMRQQSVSTLSVIHLLKNEKKIYSIK